MWKRKVVSDTDGWASAWFYSVTDGLAHSKVSGGITVEIEKVIAGEHITVGETTLLPIIRTSVSCRGVNRGVVCAGFKNLVGIVAISPEWKCAINVDGEEVAVEQYAEQVPEVKELLESR